MTSDATAVDLRASGPLEILDGALLAVRFGGATPLVRAWAGSAPLALCALAIYYVERVEGIRTLRPLFALLLVAAWWLRALALGGSARAYALFIRRTLPLPEPAPRPIDVLCTASAVGIGLWIWLWLLVFAALITPLATAGVLPFIALRGAVAPSWLARAACARERGMSAFGQAFDDTVGMRGVFLIVELLALFGAIGLFGNLYALLSFTLLLGHALLGIDVAFVSSFLSPDNTLVLLFLATATLLLFEPLRAAISAQAFVDARSRRDGADLHAAVDAAIERSAQRGRTLLRSEPPSAAALLLCASALLAPLRAYAAPGVTPDAETPAQAKSTLDEHVREQLGQILGQREFREFAESDSRSMRDLFERLFRWLDQLGEDDRKQHDTSALTLGPISPWLLMALALLALCVIGLYVGRARQTRPASGPRAAAPDDAPLPGMKPLSQLDEAARLAALGDARGALRALYIATLFALDRSRLIEYEPSRTNWQYLRGLPQGELRSAFAAFTRIFDHKWYGHEPATLDDYQACRRLAHRICDPGDT